jgi:hypothetical protein
MYDWYRNSYECIVYLNDVVIRPGESPTDLHKRFAKSTWFTRGWTLQELLAPTDLVWYDAAWAELGHSRESWKSPRTFYGDDLLTTVSKATNIPLEYVSAHRAIRTATIAQRMSWAAHRSTTRIEDEAYCLLGIFGISMPLIYGEGSAAFIRLQEEILRRTTDQSLLAWRQNPTHWTLTCDVLASSPSVFQTRYHHGEQAHLFHQPHTITANGLQMRTKLSKCRNIWDISTRLNSTFLANTTLYKLTLNYSSSGREPYSIFLRKGVRVGEANVYKRIIMHEEDEAELRQRKWEVMIEELIYLQTRPDLIELVR